MRALAKILAVSGLLSVQFVVASPHASAATSYCANSIADIAGTNGAETLYGNSLNNVVAAKGGNDTVFGRSGGDKICGGDGRDIVWGEADGDTLYGLLGNDDLHGAGGNDELRGGDGNDELWGGLGHTDAYGGPGYDVYHHCGSQPSDWSEFPDQTIEDVIVDGC